jgi:lysophospholipase L1-like esterase
MSTHHGAWIVVLALAGRLVADEPQALHEAVKPVNKTDAGWTKLHESFLERAKKGDVDVLFLGDSITRGWAGAGKEVWEEHFEPLRAANFGIGGDRTQHVLWRITEGKELDGIQPKVAVLMIGTNNLPPGNTPEQIADGITAIVRQLRKQVPAIKVLLLGVFPRGEKADNPFRARIKEVNDRIAKLDDGSHVRYLDIGGKFLAEDGSLPKEIMPDFLHLSKDGYQIWAEAIKPHVEAMLKK